MDEILPQTRGSLGAVGLKAPLEASATICRVHFSLNVRGGVLLSQR
jgi:hypothetical protein